jgi:hypothetical protein
MRDEVGSMVTGADVDGPATLAEVSHLWWFADGAIMDVETRAHLHRAWGLCGRHAWLYFRLETQLRYHPLGNAVLMADLVGRAADVFAGRHSERHKRAALEARDSCFACDHVAAHGAPSGRFADQLAAVNRGSRALQWCRASQPVWQPRMCQRCAPRDEREGAVMCRPHQVADPDARIFELGYLTQLAERLTLCQKSMTHGGPPRTLDSDAALVEAIGWCAGWHPELAMRRWS